MSPSESTSSPSRRQFSLGRWFRWITAIVLIVAVVWQAIEIRRLTRELNRLGVQVGRLPATSDAEIAAAEIPTSETLTYRARIRIPNGRRYRLAFSSFWPKKSESPQWYSATEIPAGESVVSVRIGPDPRDDLWKMTTLVGDLYASAPLPEPQVAIFRRGHRINNQEDSTVPVTASEGESIRLLDHRWVGEGQGHLFYGERSADEDQIGIFVEIQPASGLLNP